MRHREHHGEALLRERIELAEELIGIPRHIHALDHQFIIEFHTHSHDRYIGCALILPEIERLRGEEKLVCQKQRGVRLLHELIAIVKRVIDQAARLDHHRKSIIRKVVACGIKLFKHIGQERLRREYLGLFERIEQVAIERRGARLRHQPRTRLSDTARSDRKFAHGKDLDRRARRDGLPCSGKQAADLFQFIAEEIETHRIDQIAREHIDRAALRAEGSRPIELAGVLIAELHQALDQTLVILDT